MLVEPLLSVVIIWRRDTSHVKYEWLMEKWEAEENLNDTAQKLESTISRLLRSTEALPYEAFVKVFLCGHLVSLLLINRVTLCDLQELFDEHAQGILARILTKLIMFSSSIYDCLDKDQILPVVSIIGTLIFIVAIGYLMAYLV